MATTFVDTGNARYGVACAPWPPPVPDPSPPTTSSGTAGRPAGAGVGPRLVIELGQTVSDLSEGALVGREANQVDDLGTDADPGDPFAMLLHVPADLQSAVAAAIRDARPAPRAGWSALLARVQSDLRGREPYPDPRWLLARAPSAAGIQRMLALVAEAAWWRPAQRGLEDDRECRIAALGYLEAWGAALADSPWVTEDAVLDAIIDAGVLPALLRANACTPALGARCRRQLVARIAAGQPTGVWMLAAARSALAARGWATDTGDVVTLSDALQAAAFAWDPAWPGLDTVSNPVATHCWRQTRAEPGRLAPVPTQRAAIHALLADPTTEAGTLWRVYQHPLAMTEDRARAGVHPRATRWLTRAALPLLVDQFRRGDHEPLTVLAERSAAVDDRQVTRALLAIVVDQSTLELEGRPIVTALCVAATERPAVAKLSLAAALVPELDECRAPGPLGRSMAAHLLTTLPPATLAALPRRTLADALAHPDPDIRRAALRAWGRRQTAPTTTTAQEAVVARSEHGPDLATRTGVRPPTTRRR